MATPGLDEITTTTLRNRTMDKAGDKDAKKTAQAGAPVPEKDFSSKAKQAKADKGGKGGSMGKAASLPVPTATSTPAPTDNKYEGSFKDMVQDSRAARNKGVPIEQYEGSPADRVADNAGQRRMDADGHKNPTAESSYKAGTPAFQNSPKTAHSFGHTGAARDGHHRNSGHPQAHRIGKKK